MAKHMLAVSSHQNNPILDISSLEIIDIIMYILNQGKVLNKEKFWSSFQHQFSHEVENKMTTVAQWLEQKGMEKTKIQIAKQLLSEKIGLNADELIALINRLTGISEEKIKEFQ